jgi:protease I
MPAMTAAQVRAALLVDQGFDDDEFATIVELLETHGVDVTVVAPFPGRLYAGRKGRLEIGADVTVGAVRAAMFSALVIPGGYSPDRLRQRHAFLDLVRDAIARRIPIGAMGHGSQVLISANAISGRTVTCWPSIAVDVTNAGGLYVDRPVVEDRGIVTARKNDDAQLFVETILKAIGSHSR